MSVYSPPPKKRLLGLAYKIYNGNKAPGVRHSGTLPMFHIGGYHWISGANFRFFSLLVFGQRTWFKIRLRDLFLLRIRILAKENSRHRSCFAVAGQHVGQLVESGACVAYIVEQKHMPSLETVVMYAQVVYFTLVKWKAGSVLFRLRRIRFRCLWFCSADGRMPRNGVRSLRSRMRE